MKIHAYQLLCIALVVIIIGIGFQINETITVYHTPDMILIDAIFIAFLVIVSFVVFIFIVGTYIDRDKM